MPDVELNPAADPTAIIPDPPALTAAEQAAATQAQAEADAKAAADAQAAERTATEAKAKADESIRTAQAIAAGIAQGFREQQPGKDRALGRSVATTDQLLEAKHAMNADGSSLTPQQQLNIDREIELRHREDLAAVEQSGAVRASSLATLSAQYPEMADHDSPLFRAVAESIGGDPTLLVPKALLIATKAAAHDLGVQPVSKRTQGATQARAQVVQQIQSAQAAGALAKGAGGAGPATTTGARDYTNMSWKDLANEPMPQA